MLVSKEKKMPRNYRVSKTLFTSRAVQLIWLYPKQNWNT